MTESTRDRIISTLSAEQSPLRDEGLALAIDYVLDRKLTEVIDLNAAHDIVISAITAENVARIVTRHVRPGFDRFTAHVGSSKEKVGALVPDSKRIRGVVENSGLPRAKWADGMVDPTLMRRLFAPVWSNLLLSFAKRLPIPGMGGASTGAASTAARGVGSIAERLSRGVQERAEKLVDASRSVMGGLGAEVERRMQAAAREFSDSAAELFREAMRDRMKSREGAELLAQITAQIIDHVMVTELAALHEDTKHLPIGDILDVAGGVVAHSASQPFVRDVVTREIHAFLSSEGERTLRELLTELGVLDTTRAELLRRTTPIARGLFESPAFGDWLGRLIDG